MTGQVPFSSDDSITFGQGVEFAENPEPRVPCCLVLDTSGSMKGQPIRELNAGLLEFQRELLTDSLAAKRVELMVITFGGVVSVVNEFQSVEKFHPPAFSAAGQTPLGEAVQMAMNQIQVRKQIYKANGIAYYRPWIFLISDGAPTDHHWQDVALEAKNAQINKAFLMFCVGVHGGNSDTLRLFTTRDPLRLCELRFRDLFRWLSSSMKSVSRSIPGEKVNLVNPVAPDGWATI
ncbi:MAG: vWA domain-containing protein [Pirellulaceae bacterium]